jgi:hypothetical protein
MYKVVVKMVVESKGGFSCLLLLLSGVEVYIEKENRGRKSWKVKEPLTIM